MVMILTGAKFTIIERIEKSIKKLSVKIRTHEDKWIKPLQTLPPPLPNGFNIKLNHLKKKLLCL